VRTLGLRAAAVVAGILLVLAPMAAGAQSAPEWNIARVGGPSSAAGVLIAVVDTGIDPAHPAFTGRVEKAIDLVGGQGGDPNGHGTHVAGTAAGADAGCGAIGVAPDARLLPVRVLDANGEGTVGNVAEGIRRAADAGASVINLSLGSDVVLRNVSGSGLREAIEYAWGKGSIPVLAAGNDGLIGGLFGSGYGDLPAVVVTATDHQDRVAPYATSIGSAAWGIAAPGGDTSGQPGRDILSAYPSRQCALHAGTSMAAPHVSGALAVLRANGANPAQAVERMLGTARDLGRPGPDATYGHGLLDLQAALAAGRAPAPPPPPPPTQAPPATVAPATAAPASAPARPAPSTTAPPAGGGDPAPAPDQDDAGGDITDGDGDMGDLTAGESSRPKSTMRPAVQDSAARSVVADDDGGPSAGLVAAAIAALGAAGVGTGVAGRTLWRRRLQP
jgi:subtilisin family serine protease